MKFLATEKKVIRRHLDTCMGCGKNHGRSRVEEARVRRVEAAVRRRKRRDARKGVRSARVDSDIFKFKLIVNVEPFRIAMQKIVDNFISSPAWQDLMKVLTKLNETTSPLPKGFEDLPTLKWEKIGEDE